MANGSFPDVRVQARALDANGAFIPNLATTQFTVREDDEPVQIQEVSTAPLPLSENVVFVIDELVLGPRLAVVRDAILSFAQNHMQLGDQVEVLAASNGEKADHHPLDQRSGRGRERNAGAKLQSNSASGTLLFKRGQPGSN